MRANPDVDIENLPRHRRIPARLLLTALSAITIALAVPSPASAQPALWATSPEDGAALDAAPGEIALTFSDTIDNATSITVTGPDQAPIELEAPVFRDTVLIQPMLYTAPGAYTVAVNTVFADGQTLETSLAFTVESIPDVLAAEAAAPEGDTGSHPPTAAEETTDPSKPGTGLRLGVSLLAVLALVGGGILLKRRSDRRRTAAARSDLN